MLTYGCRCRDSQSFDSDVLRNHSLAGAAMIYGGRPMPDATLPSAALPPTYVRLLDDIRRRLRPVCTELPTSEFDALTTQIAEAEMKYRVALD